MSLTAQKIINRVRRDLHDSEGGEAGELYRWPDANLVDYINDSQFDLREKMPEFWLDSAGVLQTLVVASTGDLDTDLLLPDKLIRSVSGFVSYKALSEDDADTENLNRAAVFRSQYEEITR
jgi:hypothetical protein